MAAPAAPGPSPPASGYSIGALEGAVVSGIGAFVSTFSVSMNWVTGVVAALGAGFTFLVYSTYQNS